MKDYKLYQLIYNKTMIHDDLINSNVIIKPSKNDIVNYAIKYFNEDLNELIYPAKSFSVAIIYSYLLQKELSEKFYDCLSDPDLFCGNDMYFRTYSEEREIYDEIIESIQLWSDGFSLNTELFQVKKTMDYFLLEFGLLAPSYQ